MLLHLGALHAHRQTNVRGRTGVFRVTLVSGVMPGTGHGFARVLRKRGHAGCRGEGGAPYTCSRGRYTLPPTSVGVCRKREPGANPGLPRSGMWERASPRTLVIRPGRSETGKW
ncbi:hypothetical protein BQ8420_11880 [Nocardiopsis sp. JB363]|nr:hypothetical protein BQ8420_11880 [Nocardiopsis sp. JB363]